MPLLVSYLQKGYSYEGTTGTVSQLTRSCIHQRRYCHCRISRRRRLLLFGEQPRRRPPRQRGRWSRSRQLETYLPPNSNFPNEAPSWKMECGTIFVFTPYNTWWSRKSVQKLLKVFHNGLFETFTFWFSFWNLSTFLFHLFNEELELCNKKSCLISNRINEEKYSWNIHWSHYNTHHFHCYRFSIADDELNWIRDWRLSLLYVS